jgi:hypothetical protein
MIAERHKFLNKSRLHWLILGLIYFLTFSGCATFNLGPVMSPLEEKEISGEGNDKVLLMDISGVIRNKEKRRSPGQL